MNKTIEFSMKDVFGSCCDDGTSSLKYLNEKILPQIELGFTVQLDFSDVSIINSSFSNALFGNLVHHKGRSALKFLAIKNAKPIVKAEVKSGIAYGLRLSQEQAAA